MPADLPILSTVVLERSDRVITLWLDRPASLNAFDEKMHEEFLDALIAARDDTASDVLVVSGRGRAFSAGGDIGHIARNCAQPNLFDIEINRAKKIVRTLIDIEKPIICRLNGHAIGLGATIALLCDLVVAAEDAKIGDPHVTIGLVAGDGGAIAWSSRVGLTRAKEFLMTGEPITAVQALEIGLINRCVADEDIDKEVGKLCRSLLAKPQFALRKTKALSNMELKRLADLVLATGLQWESESVRDADHLEAVAALQEGRPARFSRD